jgi:hypothetical protein
VIRIRPEAYRAAFAALAADIDRILAQLLNWRAPDPEQPSSPSADSALNDT